MVQRSGTSVPYFSNIAKAPPLRSTSDTQCEPDHTRSVLPVIMLIVHQLGPGCLWARGDEARCPAAECARAKGSCHAQADAALSLRRFASDHDRTLSRDGSCAS